MSKKSIIFILLSTFLLINESALVFATINEESNTNNIVNNEKVENEVLEELDEYRGEIYLEENIDTTEEAEERINESTEYMEENSHTKNSSEEGDVVEENKSEAIGENQINDVEADKEETTEDIINKDDKEIETYSNENRTKGTAKELSLNSNYVFGAEGNYDYIWTKFSLNSDGYITVNIDKVYMGSSEKTTEVVIEDESGRNIYLSTNSSYGVDKNSVSNKWIVGLAAGTYYMKLKANFNIPMATCNIAYKIDFVKDSYFEKENNDTIEIANTISLNNIYKGILNENAKGYDYDYDFYAVDINSKNLELKVKHNIDSTFYYEVYGSYGDYIKGINEQYMEYEDGGIYKYVLTDLTPGRYYIKVSQYSNVKRELYELTLSTPLNGWYTTDGTSYYYYEVGQKITDMIKTIDGQNYYFNLDGIMQRGWQLYFGSWYYFDLYSGAMKTRWLYDSGRWYYLSIQSGKILTGLNSIEGSQYFFDSNGVMKTGWVKEGDKWYYFDSNGEMKTGWLYDSNKWYYIDKYTGEMITGTCIIEGEKYYFDNNGVMQSNKWYNDFGIWYYLKSSGAAHKGWLKENGKWYYLDEVYAYMYTGVCRVKNTLYLFDNSGVMNTNAGWKKLYGTYYYANSDGTVKTGWLKDNGKWYYLNYYGEMVTNSYRVNAATYFFGNDGAMRTGWQTINGVTYYFIENSYYAPSGSMATGYWTIDGYLHYFDSNGKLIY